MPAEVGRLQRGLGRRDRRLLAAVACAAAVGGPAAALALSGSPPPDDGCARVIKASFMGGATFRDCGRGAGAQDPSGAYVERETRRIRSSSTASLSASRNRPGPQ